MKFARPVAAVLAALLALPASLSAAAVDEPTGLSRPGASLPGDPGCATQFQPRPSRGNIPLSTESGR